MHYINKHEENYISFNAGTPDYVKAEDIGGV